MWRPSGPEQVGYATLDAVDGGDDSTDMAESARRDLGGRFVNFN